MSQILHHLDNFFDHGTSYIYYLLGEPQYYWGGIILNMKA